MRTARRLEGRSTSADSKHGMRRSAILLARLGQKLPGSARGSGCRLAHLQLFGTLTSVLSATPIVSFATDDPDDFVERLSPFVPPIRVRPEGQNFVSSARIAALSKIKVFVARARQTRVIAPSVGAICSLDVPLTGALELRTGKDALTIVPGHAYLSGAGDPLDFTFLSDAPSLVLHVTADAIAEHTADLGSSEAVPNLSGEISFSTAAGTRLFEALCSLWRVSFSPQFIGASGPEGDEVQDALIDALVDAAIGEENPPRRRLGMETSRSRAEEYIHAHLKDSLTLPQIARAVGTSPRTLNRAFRDAHGLTPMAYAKKQRLVAVRRSLIGSKPDETTVCRVANEYRFTHLSRFSSEYRDAFGERPSETLRAN
jgi:AraC-like DNA-binding protein